MAQLTDGCDVRIRTSPGFRNDITGAYLNAATVTYSLIDVTGAAGQGAGYVVASGSLAYEAASDGVYSAVLQSTDFAALPVGAKYRVVVTAAQSGIDAKRSVEGYVQQAPAG